MLSAWSRAAELADRTPTSRNRYVDFLRAASMLVVTVGHWLAAAPYLDATDTLTASHVLAVVPWTSWLTWILQVMPIFFMVGGYANGISWRAARRDGRSCRFVATQPTSGSTARECRRRVPTTRARRPRSPRPAGAASPSRSRAAISEAVGAPDAPARKMRSNSP